MHPLASRRVLLLSPVFFLLGIFLAGHVAMIGHHDSATGSTEPDGTRVESPIVRVVGWWFWPSLAGGLLLVFAAVALVPLHLVARARSAHR